MNNQNTQEGGSISLDNNDIGNIKFSLKKLVSFWILIISTLSFLVFIFVIFFLKNSDYLNSSSYLKENSFLLSSFLAFLNIIEMSTDVMYIVIFTAIFFIIFVGVYSILQSIELRKKLNKSRSIILVRFFIIQLLNLVGSVVVSLAIFMFVFVAVFLCGYADLRINTKNLLEGAIVDNQEILEKVKDSESIINIYDSSSDMGVVLAGRDLQSKEKLSVYEGAFLPIIVKIIERPIKNNAIFVPQTNSIVYLGFDENNTGDLITQLALNKIKYSENTNISKIFKTKDLPQIIYVSDEKYAELMRERIKEVNLNSINEFKMGVKQIEDEVTKCNLIDASNQKLVTGQEQDYQENCVQKINYSDCDALKETIDKNKIINQESISVCQSNKELLQSEYVELEKFIALISENEDSALEKQKNELAAGMYMTEIDTVYMRIIEGQDSFEYLKILLHELFHHYSNVSEDMPTFIEEGITEYLTSKTLGFSDYETASFSFYFKEAQVVMALFEKIPEEKLIQSYIQGDSNNFEVLFKEYFPEVDYNVFLKKGDTMFRETFGEIDETFKLGLLDTQIDHPSVQDMRSFLGLESKKFF